MRPGLSPKLFTNLVKEAIYKVPDLDLSTPDVDQMAAFLYQKSNCQHLDLQNFTFSFFKVLADPQLLESSFYSGIIEEIRDLLSQHSGVRLCSWTQGNIFLQTSKAQVFQAHLEDKYLAEPCIYASPQKIQLLPVISQSLEEQGAEIICLLDDKPSNIQKAYQVLSDRQNLILINKIRPDKKTKPLNLKAPNVWRVETWEEIKQILASYRSVPLALIMDKDGIVFNTTYYRKRLETLLAEWLATISVV